MAAGVRCEGYHNSSPAPMIRNLVLCYSPFQAFIWINLQRQYSIQNITFAYITTIDSEKDKFYYHKARDACEAGAYFFLSGNVLSHISSIRAAFRILKLFDVQINLYLASFNTFHSLYIFSALNTATVNIYDDGAFSLLSRDDQLPYRWNTAKLHLSKRIIYSLLLKYKTDQSILERASVFYTIFPQKLVAFPGLTTLPVDITLSSSNYATDRSRQTGPIKVFIGDATHLYSDDLFIDYQMILNSLKCDYYLQHPRDLRSHNIYFPAAVSTPLIAEEFIADLLSLGEIVHIYTLASTALFSVSHPRLKKTIVNHPDFSPKSLIDIAEHFSIDIIESDIIISEIQSTV